MPAKPINPADYQHPIPKDIRNESGKPADQVIAQLMEPGAGVEIQYGDLKMLALKSQLDLVRLSVSGFTSDERQMEMRRITSQLRQSHKKVLSGKASVERMNTFYMDLLFWTALQETSLS